MFRRLTAVEEDSGPAAPAAAPTDVRLLSLSRPEDLNGTAEPGVPADQGGDPELDIDQDLDRAADPAPEDEQSRPLELPGFDLPGLDLSGLDLSRPGLPGMGSPGVADPRTGYDPDLSGPFDAVEGAEGTGTFSGLFTDAALADADETGVVPAAGAGWTDGAHRLAVRRPGRGLDPAGIPGRVRTGRRRVLDPRPAGSYETEYGWPTPVERLPEVPPYPPASGFDVPAEVEAEPTRLVPQWPPARPDDRIELPRSWSHRGETGPAFRTAVERTLRRRTSRPRVSHRRTGPAGRFGDDEDYAEDEQRPPALRRARDRTGRPDGTAPGRECRESATAGDSEGLRSRGASGTSRVPVGAAEADQRGPGTDQGGTVRRPGGEPGRPDLDRAGGARGRHAGSHLVPGGSRRQRRPPVAPPGRHDAPPARCRSGRRPGRDARPRRHPGAAPDGTGPPDQGRARPDQLRADQQRVQPDQPRSRPRPRPRPGSGQPEPRSTVYVSRHAAEPS